MMVAFPMPATAFLLPPDVAPHGRANDCTPNVYLGAGPSLVRYVIWCGTQVGRVKFSVRPARGIDLVRFDKSIEPVGSGKKSAFHCRERARSIFCTGRKSGPVTLRGWVTVLPSTRCAKPVTLKGPYDIYQGLPYGCPPFRPEKPPTDFGYFRGFRHNFGFDRDLHENRRAIKRRFHKLLRAWRRGNPVARWTVSSLGLPLSAREQRELDYRERYIDHNATAIERWASRHAVSTYAGYDVDHMHGGVFYIGFVGDQEAQLAAFKNQVGPLAPDRIKSFPMPPTHSERELYALLDKLLEDSALWRTANSMGIDTLANKIEVGTEHVEATKTFLAERYGPDAPLKVVFARPLVLLKASRWLMRPLIVSRKKPRVPGVPLWDQEFIGVSAKEKGEDRSPLARPKRLRVWFTREHDERVDGQWIAWEARCNSYAGRLRITKTRLKIRGFGGTMMGCPPVTDREDTWLLRFFGSDPKWQWRSGRLTLSSNGDVIELSRSERSLIE
jgi:META domain